MKKSLFQKVLCLILSVTTLLGIFSVSIFAAVSDDKDYASSNNNTAATKDEMTALVGIPTYAEYLEKHVGLPEKQTTELKVDITNPDMIVTDDGKTTVGQGDSGVLHQRCGLFGDFLNHGADIAGFLTGYASARIGHIA